MWEAHGDSMASRQSCALDPLEIKVKQYCFLPDPVRWCSSSHGGR